jgi:hypothetical protein
VVVPRHRHGSHRRLINDSVRVVTGGNVFSFTLYREDEVIEFSISQRDERTILIRDPMLSHPSIDILPGLAGIIKKDFRLVRRYSKGNNN